MTEKRVLLVLDKDAAWKRNLGKIISQFYALGQEENAAYDDLMSFGDASDCGHLVAASYRNKRADLMEKVRDKWGCTGKQLIDEFKERTGYSYNAHCILATTGLLDFYPDEYEIDDVRLMAGDSQMGR